MKRLIWLLPISLVLRVTSCLKDEMNETIVLMGTESYVKPIDSIIPDTLLRYIGDSAVMGENAIVPPAGNMPPNIQGEFVFGPRELFSYNETYHGNLDTLYIRIGGVQGAERLQEVSQADALGLNLLQLLVRLLHLPDGIGERGRVDARH